MTSFKNSGWLLWAASLALSPSLAAEAVAGGTTDSVTASTRKVPVLSDFTPAQIDRGDVLSYLNQVAKNNSDSFTTNPSRRGTAGCSLSNLRIRREWRTLNKPERKSYIAAVKCLRTKPSLLDPVAFPGSKSLFDDFVAIHLVQTLNIHLSATFLTWHRYFTYTYEERLRNDCGYTGAVPYWEWGLDVNNPAASPVFDGSDTSLGGNGQYIPHAGMVLTEPFNASALIPLPSGSGGGCVTTGPFANMVVHLGPVAVAQYGGGSISVANPLADNPRCLKRDLNAGIAKRFTSFFNTTSLILKNNDIEHFQAIMQADPRYVHGQLGVHGGGHFTMGGDPGSDPFISPGDPAFFLHHSQIDRVYWIWQLLDLPHRQNVFGTGSFLDYLGGPPTTLSDIIDISPLAPPRTIGQLMNTFSGTPFCYIYL